MQRRGEDFGLTCVFGSGEPAVEGAGNRGASRAAGFTYASGSGEPAVEGAGNLGASRAAGFTYASGSGEPAVEGAGNLGKRSAAGFTYASGSGEPAVEGAGNLGKRSAAGFTLIEVIGAMMIFVAGVLVASSLASELTRLMRDARFRSEAAAIGRQTLDSLSTHGYEDLSVGTISDSIAMDDLSYMRTRTVSQHNVRTREVFVRVVPPIDDGLDCLGTAFCGSIYLVDEW